LTKQLIVIDKDYSDFRDKLISSYKQDHEIITENEFKICDYKIIVGGNSISRKDTIIFNKEKLWNGIQEDYLLSLYDYEVDSSSFPRNLCSQKSILFSFLSYHKIPVQSLFSRTLPPTKYLIEFNSSSPLQCKITESSKINFENGPFLAWNSPEIRGFLIYYYFKKPVIVSNIIYEDQNTILLRSTFPIIKYTKFKRATSEYISPFIQLKPDNKDRKLLNTMGFLRPEIVSKITKIPNCLNSNSCEILIGEIDSGLVVLNVEHTHNPFNKNIMDDKDFIDLMLKKFWEEMEASVITRI